MKQQKNAAPAGKLSLVKKTITVFAPLFDDPFDLWVTSNKPTCPTSFTGPTCILGQ